MKNIKINVFLASMIFCLNVVSAHASSFACVPAKIKTQDKSIILNVTDKELVKNATIYFVKNTSTKSVWLDHPTKHAGASAGWSSYLQPDHWSALLLDKKDFSLTCAVIQPGKVDYLNCEKVLSVCLPTQVTFQSKRKASYWLVEDKSWNNFLLALKKRGVK